MKSILIHLPICKCITRGDSPSIGNLLWVSTFPGSTLTLDPFPPGATLEFLLSFLFTSPFGLHLVLICFVSFNFVFVLRSHPAVLRCHFFRSLVTMSAWDAGNWTPVLHKTRAPVFFFQPLHLLLNIVA